MKMRNDIPVILQRGEAIIDDAGNVIVSGKTLLREKGTERNFGFNKIIHKHGISKDDAMQIPKILRGNKPNEITERGRQTYEILNKNNEKVKLVTSPLNDGRMVASMYRLDR